MTETWARPYLQPLTQKPQILYAVLGQLEWDDETQEFAADLPQSLLCRPIEADYFRKGPLWDQFVDDQPELAEEAEDASFAIVVNGEIEYQDSLDYLRDVIEFLTFLVESGGCVVYDPYTLSWLSPEDWDRRSIEGQIFNPFDHVILLASPEGEAGYTWLHTRGLQKFGRPDLSVPHVPNGDIEHVKKIVDRFINFQALGGVIEEGREVELPELEQKFVPSAIQGHPEDPDFNNYHIELKPSKRP